ncbi:hypothetical protein VW35_02430 [Devosia soli]|uniref:Uncharacterized protein n=1 Tax=Devosia soli TaxID=361041 RepID=A0A0F5LFT6_9HYPH|nr:hypothetical protein VW35_02430 [Devosia soli]
MQVARIDHNSRVTHYVVQSYRKMGKSLVADEARVATSEAECLRWAQSTAARRQAVIAFLALGTLIPATSMIRSYWRRMAMYGRLNSNSNPAPGEQH